MAEPKRTDLSVRLERAALVGILRPGREKEDEESFDELHRLAESAGAHLAGSLTQRRRKPDPKFYVGKGKVEELRPMVDEASIDIIIVNHELKPAQVKALETALDTKVIDRTELILDIFASRARTKLAKLQVELAQLEYSLPRLARLWTHLSRIEGGIGMRGPGERQIEEDRRVARRRIAELKEKLFEIGRRRERMVASRRSRFKISLVGYTNSGKSTLLNRLTGARTLVQDRLFATLDTKTRAWDLGNGRTALLSDTVGFVRDLPHSLVASFHATLEETRNADLLLHVVDLSARDLEGQIRSVQAVLEEIGSASVPVVMVFNKADRCSEPIDLEELKRAHPEHSVVSALQGTNLEDLQAVVTRAADRAQVEMTFLIPHDRGRLLSRVRAVGRIVDLDYTDEGAQVRALLPRAEGLKLAKALEGPPS